MLKKHMLYLFFSSCYSHAATLSCETFIAETIDSIGGHATSETPSLILTRMTPENISLPERNVVVVSMPVEASYALANVRIALTRTSKKGGLISNNTFTRVIQPSVKDYTIDATWPFIVKDHEETVVVLFTDSVNRSIMSEAITTVTAVHTRYVEDKTLTENGYAYIKSSPEKTDAIIFPDLINLGSLNSEGYTFSNEVIQYETSTNDIPVKFFTTNTPLSAFTVNGQIVSSTDNHTPPFRFGMYLYPNAQPGVYTSTVNASWTCP